MRGINKNSPTKVNNSKNGENIKKSKVQDRKRATHRKWLYCSVCTMRQISQITSMYLGVGRILLCSYPNKCQSLPMHMLRKNVHHLQPSIRSERNQTPKKRLMLPSLLKKKMPSLEWVFGATWRTPWKQAPRKSEPALKSGRRKTKICHGLWCRI